MKEPSEEFLVELLNGIEKRTILTELEVELSNEVINDAKKIKEAIRVLNSAKRHYDDDKVNWAIERAIRVLEGECKNEDLIRENKALKEKVKELEDFIGEYQDDLIWR